MKIAPLSLKRTLGAIAALSLMAGCASQKIEEPVPAVVNVEGVQEAVVTVREGYHPNHIEARAGEALKLVFVRDEPQGHSCGQTLVIPARNLEAELPSREPYIVNVSAAEAHGTLDFQCGMNMMKGRVTFSESPASGTAPSS